MQFRRYHYQNPDALPVERDAPAGWAEPPIDDPDGFAQVIRAAGFDPADPEIGIGRLAEPWNGHPAGALVVSGLTVEGHPFAVQVC